MDRPIPIEVLKHVREAAGLRSGALAKAMDANPSVISRLEKQTLAEPSLAARYLKTIATPLSAEVVNFYERDWVKSQAPSFLHPNREELWHVELALQELDKFEKSPRNAPILRGPIGILREELAANADYLQRRDHTVAWVGDIGVGKTTALAHSTSMVITDAKGQIRSVFPVGAGRTTVCETVIKSAPAFGIAVDPLTEDEIRSLTKELVLGANPNGAAAGVSAEMARVLRNLAGMRLTRSLSKGAVQIVDPISDLFKKGLTDEQIVDEMIGKMNLPARNETQLILSEEAEDGMEWLARNISEINYGQHQRFSAPRRITVLLPSPLLTSGGHALNIIDTKGIESITQRPDLRSLIDDPRTLTILCAKFADAPGATVQRILKENGDAGSDAHKKARIGLLILPRGGEATQVNSDIPVASREDGYAVRAHDISISLNSLGLPALKMLFYDAHNDESEQIWIQISELVHEMRAIYVDRLNRTVASVNHLVLNADAVMSREARVTIRTRIDRLVTRLSDLPSERRMAHQNLIDQFDLAHQSSIAASIVRRGDWENFPVLHILGVGVRNDANLRTADHFKAIDHELASLQDEFSDVADINQTLLTLQDRVSEWRQDFLANALSIGRDSFRVTLEKETDLWRDSVQRYGGGPGYKRDLADVWRQFFETSKADSARNNINTRLERIWAQIILNPLLEATRADD